MAQNLKEFLDRVDTNQFIEAYRNPMSEEWAKRTGILELDSPYGSLHLATDVIHVLNLLKSHGEAALEQAMEPIIQSSVSEDHIRHYLECLADRGILAIGPSEEAELPTFDRRTYRIKGEELTKYEVKKILPAPCRDKKRVLSTNICDSADLYFGKISERKEIDLNILQMLYPID